MERGDVSRILEQAEELISSDQIEGAFKVLRQIKTRKYKNQFTNLSGKYTRLNSRMNSGVLSEAEYGVELSKIRIAILSTISSIETELTTKQESIPSPDILTSQQQKQNTRRSSLLKIIGLVTILILIGTVAVPFFKTQLKVGTASDNQNNTYETIRIAGKTWLAENMNCDIDGSFCYDDDPGNCQKYGRLYNWLAAKKVCDCLEGNWRLPSEEEWDQLLDEYGSEGGAFYEALIKGGGSGFAALLGGYRNTDGSFLNLGANGNYWSATERDGGNAYYYNFHGDVERLGQYSLGKGLGLSVRCLQD